MQGIDYKARFVFRMIHCENLEFVLNNGMHARNNPIQDPDYINIGDIHLIEQRTTYHVGINPPGGSLGDYIPFYFGGHSPMLLNIKTGNRGIQQRQQDDIIYLVCKIQTLVEHCSEWCFTDGHAKNNFTEFFNDVNDLCRVDWGVVGLQYWNNDEHDRDRMRKKQAEFLVKTHVPANCIAGIIVKTPQREQFVKEILSRSTLDIKVKVDSNNKYYYP